jgi:hypothetical protein
MQRSWQHFKLVLIIERFAASFRPPVINALGVARLNDEASLELMDTVIHGFNPCAEGNT